MTPRTRLAPLAALLATLGLAASAAADPLLGADALTPVTARLLAEQARLDRRVHPAAWQRVADVQGVRPEVYLATRLRRPSVARELTAMGAEAVMPLVDLLAGGGFGRDLSDDERQALTLGALEALAAQRDPRASGVLRAAFTRLTDRGQLRAAARGIAGLGTAGDLAFLVSHLNDPGGRGLAALEGLGAQRSRASLDIAATALRATTDPDAVAAASRALGEIGSTWAQAAGAQGSSLPDAAAEALVPAFLRARGAARDAVQSAILACGAPRAAALLTAALPAADGPTQARIRFMVRAIQRGS